jgi:hypothetical protein
MGIASLNPSYAVNRFSVAARAAAYSSLVRATSVATGSMAWTPDTECPALHVSRQRVTPELPLRP